MNELKRKLSSDDYSQESRITHLEDLSNEYFYDIFEYLDSYDVYKIFSKLNSRFYQIINDQCFLFRFDIVPSPSDDYLDYVQYNLIHNRHRIRSIDAFDMRNESVAKLISSIDSSYIYLQEIYLLEIEVNTLIQLLHQYSDLPCLTLLDIDIDDGIKCKQTIDIYQLVFTLSNLKSFRFAVSIDDGLFYPLPLPIASTKEQYTRIQYLHLDHCVDLDDLYSILSYTPNIFKLTVTFVLDDKKSNVEHKKQLSLSNLKYLSIEHYEATLDDLDKFFSKINCRLESFHILIMHRQDNYHIAYQWQEFIRKYFRYLKDFHFIFQEANNSQSDILKETLQFRQVCSAFWSYIPLNFELDISESDIKHTITPYQYEYTKINSSMKLCLTKIDLEQSFSLIISHIHQILFLTKIDHVQIKKISIGTLVKLLKLVPQLTSVHVSRLLVNETTDGIEKTNENQITKVCLGILNDPKQIDLLFKIFPRMKYFRINSTKNLNIPICFHYIINKTKTILNNQLQYISFHSVTAVDQNIEFVQMMIQSEKLLFDYVIQRALNDIYIGWK